MRCSKDVLALTFITLKVYFTFSIQHMYLYQCNTMTNQRRLDLHVPSYLNYSFKMSLHCLSFFSITGLWTGIITCCVKFFVEFFFLLKDRSLQRKPANPSSWDLHSVKTLPSSVLLLHVLGRPRKMSSVLKSSTLELSVFIQLTLINHVAQTISYLHKHGFTLRDILAFAATKKSRFPSSKGRHSKTQLTRCQ